MLALQLGGADSSLPCDAACLIEHGRWVIAQPNCCPRLHGKRNLSRTKRHAEVRNADTDCVVSRRNSEGVRAPIATVHDTSNLDSRPTEPKKECRWSWPELQLNCGGTFHAEVQVKALPGD